MSSSGSRGRGARTVLCTNGLLSKTLAVVRSLGARNIRVIVSEKIRFHTSGFSKYSAKTLTYPDPVVNGGAFLEWLVGTITREGIDVVFPMDDDTMEIAIHHRAELERLCGLPIPPTGSYMVAADKSNTMKLAMSAGVPCPRTLELSVHGQPTGEQFALIESSLEYPLAIKPRQSAGGRGVRFVHNRDELISTYQAIHAEYPNPIVQEYIPPGPKYDVCLCYDRDNKLRASFAQKRIRNFPIDRGSSTVHESVDAPELLAHALKFMAHLPWYGIADFEFMVDPRDGRLKLLEINPRFWSTLRYGAGSISRGFSTSWRSAKSCRPRAPTRLASRAGP